MRRIETKSSAKFFLRGTRVFLKHRKARQSIAKQGSAPHGSASQRRAVFFNSHGGTGRKVTPRAMQGKAAKRSAKHGIAAQRSAKQSFLTLRRGFMYYAEIEIKSSTPLLYGRRHTRPDKDGIGHAAFDAKYWKDRAHIDSAGFCYIPRHAFKMALCTAAQKLKLKYKGMTTWASFMGPSCKVLSDVVLDQKESALKAFSRDVPSNGRPGGGGTRVTRTFAMLEKWSGTVEVQIIIPVLTEEIFTRHLNYLGLMVGLGMWSPRRNGDYGTFLAKIKSFEDRDGWPDLGFSVGADAPPEGGEEGDEEEGKKVSARKQKG